MFYAVRVPDVLAGRASLRLQPVRCKIGNLSSISQQICNIFGRATTESNAVRHFMIANSAGAVAWALFYGLGAYYLGKGVEEFARPIALALAVVGAIVVVSLIAYWRRKEQELAAAAEREIPGSLQAEQSGEADG
jgi:hypothetical protein